MTTVGAAASVAQGADAARPTTSGNAQAKKCLEDFVTRLEATVKKRMRVKVGTMQTVDWTKLSIVLAGVPAYKSRPPILPSSRTWRTDLAVEMKPETKQLLRDVFIRYCGWGDSQNFMFISRQQFIRFARDMGMCTAGMEEVDALGLSGLFDKILLGSLDPGAASRLAMSDFVLAVTGLGTRLCPAPTVQEAFEAVVAKYVLPRLSLPLPEPDPVEAALLHMDLVTTLEKLRTKLQVLWDAYMAQQAAAEGGAGAGAGGGSGGSTANGMTAADGKPPQQPHSDWAATPAATNGGGHASPATFAAAASFASSAGTAAAAAAAANGGAAAKPHAATMTLATFLRFCSDFEITVSLLSKIQLIQTFKRSRYGSAADVIDSNPHTSVRLTFPEWLDCLARCSLLAFDYQPPPVHVPTLDFKGAYHTAAKQLWLRDATAGGGGGSGRLYGDDDEEEELQMPAAVNEAMGNEDRPHYDETFSRAPSAWRPSAAGGGDAAGRAGGGGEGGYGRERLISHAVSIAQGRTRRQDPEANAEMMLIHAEPSTMLQDPNKPLHLQPFTCDWVGRPGLTLSETGRLQQRSTDPWMAAGIYHTQTGVDPAYEQRGADMAAARLVREQHMEALKLHYQAARREAIRDTTRQAASRRQELELVAGQTIARVMGATAAAAARGGSPCGSPAVTRAARTGGSPGVGQGSVGHGAGRGRQGGARSGTGSPAPDGGDRAAVQGVLAQPCRRASSAGSVGRPGGGDAHAAAVAGGNGNGSGGIVWGLEEVASRTGGNVGGATARRGGPGKGGGGGGMGGTGAGAAGARSRTLVEELQDVLDFESRLPRATVAGHGAIRFG